MASVELEIAARSYSVACRDGEEEHLRALAAIVNRKAEDAASALGGLGEARQLLYASLLLADEIKDRQSAGAPATDAGTDSAAAIGPALAAALERLADRTEELAQRLEGQAASA